MATTQSLAFSTRGPQASPPVPYGATAAMGGQRSIIPTQFAASTDVITKCPSLIGAGTTRNIALPLHTQASSRFIAPNGGSVRLSHLRSSSPPASPGMSTRSLSMTVPPAIRPPSSGDCFGRQRQMFVSGSQTSQNPNSDSLVSGASRLAYEGIKASSDIRMGPGPMSTLRSSPSGVVSPSTSLSETCRQHFDLGAQSPGACGFRDTRPMGLPSRPNVNGAVSGMKAGTPIAQVRVLNHAEIKQRHPQSNQSALKHQATSVVATSNGVARTPGTGAASQNHAKQSPKIPKGRKIASPRRETRAEDSKNSACQRRASIQSVDPNVDNSTACFAESLRPEVDSSRRVSRCNSPIEARVNLEDASQQTVGRTRRRSLQSAEPYADSAHLGSSTALFAESLRSDNGDTKRNSPCNLAEDPMSRDEVSNVIERLARTDTSSSFYRRRSSVGEEGSTMNQSSNALQESPGNSWRENLRQSPPNSPRAGSPPRHASPRAASITRRLSHGSQSLLERLPGRCVGNKCTDIGSDSMSFSTKA